MENKERLKRLSMLHNMLRNHGKLFKQVEFDMETFHTETHQYDENDVQVCATAACALGSAALYRPFNDLGLIIDRQNGSGVCTPIFYIRNSYARGFAAGKEFFGLTMKESDFLFDPERYPPDEEIRPNTVATRVRELIAKYKANTPPKKPVKKTTRKPNSRS